MRCVTIEQAHKPPSHALRWPEVNAEQLRAIVKEGQTLADLWERSPFRLDSNEPATETIVDTLFPDNPLLCCGWDFQRCQTKPRQEWRGLLSKMQFIVPSPMSKEKGKTTQGRLSPRSLENTDKRRFLVIEFDFREPVEDVNPDDACVSLLLHLAEYAPLALVVDSGGKSLHGWYYCAGQAEAKLRLFMNYAVSLGADPMTWTRCQFVRMPDGLRDNGRRQRVFFFNPEVIR